MAIATGHPGPDVLDVDIGPAGNGFAAFEPAEASGTAHRSQRAGPHPLRRLARLLHRHRISRAGSLPRHFIDFKAAGGYVLAPPSFVQADGKPAGTYELLDQRDGTGRLDWQAVRPLLDPPAPARRAWPPRPAPGRLRRTWRRGSPALAEGNRNAGLYWAACRLAEAGHAADARPAGRGRRPVRPDRDRGPPDHRVCEQEGHGVTDIPASLDELDPIGRAPQPRPHWAPNKRTSAAVDRRSGRMAAAGMDAGAAAVACEFVKRQQRS